MGKRKKTIAVILLILLLLGIGLWAWPGRHDAQVEKVKQMHAALFQEGGPSHAPPPREKMEAIRQEMNKLSPSQRREVMDSMRQQMDRMMEKRIDDYFALPSDQRAAYLDNEIKEMEKRRKEMEANRPQEGVGSRNPGFGPPPGGPGGLGGPGGPGGRPPGPPPSMGSDAGKERRNRMLDHISPARRAKFDAYFADMAKRRIAMGLPAMPSHPHGPPPPRPGP